MKNLLLSLFVLLFLSGCAIPNLIGGPVKYVTPGGQTVETDSDVAFLMAQRDIVLSSDQAFNESVKSAKSDFAIFAMTVNKMLTGKITLQQRKTWDERLLPWLDRFLNFYGGGMRKSFNGNTSYVYAINGDNNNMSGMHNTAIGGGGGTDGDGGSVVQDLSVDASPYYERDQSVDSHDDNSDNSSVPKQ